MDLKHNERHGDGEQPIAQRRDALHALSGNAIVGRWMARAFLLF
jgi:hypothetical protein